VGDCLLGGPARQRSDLTAAESGTDPGDDIGPSDPVIRFVVMVLLALDGVLSAVAAALLLPSYIGTVPFPVSALVGGLVNGALVWAAARWTRSPRLAALPLWTWLLTVTLMTLGLPNDAQILDGAGVLRYGVLLLIVLGVAPPLWVLSRFQGCHS
jgi:hypothetical protein